MSQPPEEPPPGGWPAPSGWTRPAGQPGPGPESVVPPPARAPSPEVTAPPSEPPAGGPGMTLPPGWAPRSPEHKPGVIPLRPLGVGDLFSGTFATIRGHWRTLLTVAGSVAAVTTLVALPALLAAQPVVRAFAALTLLDPNAGADETRPALDALVTALADFAPWLLVMFTLQMMSAAIIEAGSALVVGSAVLGRTISRAEVMSRLLRLLPRLLLLGLLMAASIGLGLLLCLIPGLVIAFLWFGAPSALVLENVTPLTALRRSAQLVGQSFWRVVGVLLLVQIVYGVAIQIVSAPVSLIASAGVIGTASQSIPTESAVNLMLLGYFALAIVWLLTYPLVAVARVLEYLDLRMRHESLAESLIEVSKD